MGRTALNRSFVPRGDDFVAHPDIRQLPHAADERSMIVRVGGARRDAIGHGAAVVEEMVSDAAIAAVNDCRQTQI